MSKGMGMFAMAGSCIAGSFMTLALTASLCARDLYTINEKNTVSPGLALAIFGKVSAFMLGGMPSGTLGFKSSPTHSKYCSATCFFQSFLPIVAIFLYA